MSHLVIDNVTLVYQRSADDRPFLALDSIGAEVARGEFVTIVGPSGCGKSSLLLLVSGLLRPTSGSVSVNGRRITATGPDRALVFQEFALLPWRTVLGNVELGLELQGQPARSRREIARGFIRLVGLAAFEHYFPHQLSGGMRQRVGIARALSVDPEVLLMDEPFGALDAQMRQLMAAELLTLWERDRKTILFVTHDIDEAVFLADRVIVMSASPGRILDTLTIDLPRPRGFDLRSSPRFVEYRQRIWDRLEEEVRAAVSWETSEVPLAEA